MRESCEVSRLIDENEELRNALKCKYVGHDLRIAGDNLFRCERCGKEVSEIEFMKNF